MTIGKKKRWLVLALLISLFAVTAMPVSASGLGIDDEIKVNDIIDGEEGKEVVIKVLNDGRFITVPFDEAVMMAACNHTSIVGTGTKHKVTSSYNKTDSTYCYKYRYYEDAVCARCGKTGFKIYDSTWTKVKHKYKLFGKTCTVCGYEK